jgi:hypothetical protein
MTPFKAFSLAACIAVSALSAAPAFGDDFDRTSVRGEVYCFPTQYAIETVRKLQDADPSKMDVIAPPLKPRFRVFDGGGLPQRYFITGAAETDFTIEADGATPDFLSKVAQADKDSDICIQDKTRMGRPGDDEGLYFEMGLTPEFKNATGRFTLAELEEGTKDGRSIYKKMIPAAARLFMPSTDHLSLRYLTAGTPFQAVAYRGGEALPPIDAELYNEAYIFDLDDLKALKADTLEIKGGDYVLSPVPSVKTMKRFGIGEKKIYTQNEAGEWVR